MADKTLAQLEGILEDVLIKVGNFIFSMDFVIIDIEKDKQLPLAGPSLPLEQPS